MSENKKKKVRVVPFGLISDIVRLLGCQDVNLLLPTCGVRLRSSSVELWVIINSSRMIITSTFASGLLIAHRNVVRV